MNVPLGMVPLSAVLNSELAFGENGIRAAKSLELTGPMDPVSKVVPSFYTGSISQTAESHFYDSENHLRLFNRHNGIDAISPPALTLPPISEVVVYTWPTYVQVGDTLR